MISIGIKIGNRRFGTTAWYRSEAHEAFDQLWQGGYMTRSEAYAWLADKLGMSRRECHMRTMSKADCKLVITCSEQETEDILGKQ